MVRTGCLVALVLVCACKKPDRKARCNELVRQTALVAEGLAKGLGAKESPSQSAELKQELAELEKECLTWPDEVFECMRSGDDTEKCREAMARTKGVAPSGVDKAPAGPPVVATATLGKGPYLGGHQPQLAGNGSLIVLENEGVASFDATGAQRWRVSIDHGDWIVPLDGAVLITDDKTRALVALDPAAGNEMWRQPIPRAADADEYTDISAEGAIRAGERVIVALADGRFLDVDPRACDPASKPPARAKPACTRPLFGLPDETLDDPKLALAGDHLVLGESGLVRVLTRDGKTIAAVHVRDSLGGIAATPAGLLAINMDEELVVFDPARCGASKVALPRKKGRMYIRGEGECDDCVSAPPGCLVTRAEFEVDYVPPLVTKDGSIVFTTSDGVACLGPDGKKRWQSDVPAFGPLVEHAGGVFAIASTVGDNLDDAPIRAVAIDPADGKVRWARQLATKAGAIVSNDEVTVAAAGPWLVGGYKGSISWLEAP